MNLAPLTTNRQTITSLVDSLRFPKHTHNQTPTHTVLGAYPATIKSLISRLKNTLTGVLSPKLLYYVFSTHKGPPSHLLPKGRFKQIICKQKSQRLEMQTNSRNTNLICSSTNHDSTKFDVICININSTEKEILQNLEAKQQQNVFI